MNSSLDSARRPSLVYNRTPNTNIGETSSLEQQKTDLKNIRADMWKVDLAIDYESDNVHLLLDYQEMSIIRYELEFLYWNRIMLKNGVAPLPESVQISELKRQLKGLMDKSELYVKKLDQSKKVLQEATEHIRADSLPLVYVKEQNQQLESLEKIVRKDSQELLTVLQKYRSVSKELLKIQVKSWNAITDTKLSALQNDNESRRTSFRDSLIGALLSPTQKTKVKDEKAINWMKRLSSTLTLAKPKKNRPRTIVAEVPEQKDTNRLSDVSNENNSDCSTLPASAKSQDTVLLMRCAELKNSLTYAGVSDESVAIYNELVLNRNRQSELEKELLRILEPEPLTDTEQKSRTDWIIDLKSQYNDLVEEISLRSRKSPADLKEIEIVSEALQEIEQLMPVLEFKSVFAHHSLKVTSHRTQKLLQELVNVKFELQKANQEIKELRLENRDQRTIIENAAANIPDFIQLYDPNPKMKPKDIDDEKPISQTEMLLSSNCYICVEPFLSNWPGYISIVQGDILNVLMTFTDSSCFGTNLSSGETGIFPVNCVELVQSG